VKGDSQSEPPDATADDQDPLDHAHAVPPVLPRAHPIFVRARATRKCLHLWAHGQTLDSVRLGRSPASEKTQSVLAR
jgi:hypothetical protein